MAESAAIGPETNPVVGLDMKRTQQDVLPIEEGDKAVPDFTGRFGIDIHGAVGIGESERNMDAQGGHERVVDIAVVEGAVAELARIVASGGEESPTKYW